MRNKEKGELHVKDYQKPNVELVEFASEDIAKEQGLVSGAGGNRPD